MTEETKKEYRLVAEGKYTAKAVDGGFSKNGKQYMIRFQITTEGDEFDRYATYFGGFDDGLKYTLEALDVVGYDGESDLAEFQPKGDVEIVVKHRTMPEKGVKGQPDYMPAKMTDNVRFVNRIGGRGGNLEKVKLAPAEAKQASASVMAKIRAAKGVKAPAPKSAFARDGSKDDDIPF